VQARHGLLERGQIAIQRHGAFAIGIVDRAQQIHTSGITAEGVHAGADRIGRAIFGAEQDHVPHVHGAAIGPGPPRGEA
jgi:hypothetical protein